MNPSHRLGWSVMITGVMAALSAGPAWAQTEPASRNSDDAPHSEIVVTAQKRSERLQDVPISVAVLNSAELSRQGVVRFTDYASRVPGLSLTSIRTGQAQITLRGITTGAAQSASATGYYIDEAPIGSVNAYAGGSSTTPDLDPSDLRQIEVLKGPQGTLYGAGAVGGLLKFATTPVDLSAASGRLRAGISSAAKGGIGYAARGLVNVPLAADRLALRVSGFYRRDAGYIDNVNPRVGRKDVNSANVRGGRAVLAAKLGEGVRIDLSAILQDTKANGLNTVDVDAVTLRPRFGDLTQSRQLAETGFATLRLYNATIRADLGGINAVSSTTYQHTRFTSVLDGTRGFGAALGPRLGTPNLGLRQVQTTRTERWSQELRLGADGVAGGLLDLQGGLYWTHEDASNRLPNFGSFLTTTGAAVTLPTLVDAKILSKYEEYSVFGNVRVHLGEAFDVLGGLRYSHDKQDYFQDYAGLLIGARRVNTGQETGNIVTWMVSPRYRFSPQAMIYARAASGYRPGGPNAVPPPSVFAAPDTFNPDKLTQFEVGFKGETGDGALSLDAALFYTIWRDIQIQTSAAGFNFFVNGGKARSQGGEMTLRYRPIAGLMLTGNAAYTDARLTTAAPAAGGRDGDRLPYVPRWSGAFNADYSLSLGGDFTASFGGGVNFASDRFSDYSQRLRKRLPGYATFDLRAGIARGNWTLSAFVKNLTDKRVINVAASAGLAPSNTAGATYAASFNQPRTIGAEAAITF